MPIGYCLSFIFLISFSLLSSANILHTETLPNGKTVAFYKSSKKTLSEKQLKKIEQDINTRIKGLSNHFKKQSPEENLSSLLQLKNYLDNIYKKEGMKYAPSNTNLHSQILLLSSLLNSLPQKKKFQPKNCQQYIHRLRVQAHVSVNSDELNDWISKVLQLSEQLCPKDTKHQIVESVI